MTVSATASLTPLPLPHAVADDFAAAEFHLLPVHREILFHLDEQRGIGEAHPVADGRAEHLGISLRVTSSGPFRDPP